MGKFTKFDKLNFENFSKLNLPSLVNYILPTLKFLPTWVLGLSARYNLKVSFTKLKGKNYPLAKQLPKFLTTG